MLILRPHSCPAQSETWWEGWNADICVLIRPPDDSDAHLSNLLKLKFTDEIYKAIAKPHPAPSLISATHSFPSLTTHGHCHCDHTAFSLLYILALSYHGQRPPPLFIGKCRKRGKEGGGKRERMRERERRRYIPMIQNRSGQASHRSPPFNRWKMSTVKRLGELSNCNFSKRAYFGWLDVITYRFESQLQREDIIRS